MYLPPMNGYTNPYSNNSNNKLPHVPDVPQPTTDFRPYKMINPPSPPKHLSPEQNVSNMHRTVSEMYDMNNGDMSASNNNHSNNNMNTNSSNSNNNSSASNTNINNNGGSNVLSNDELMSLPPRHPPNLHNSHMSMMMNQHQHQHQHRGNAEDVYNFAEDDIHSMSPHSNHMGGMGGGGYGLSLQQMRNSVGSGMMSGYSSMNSMNGANQMTMKNSMLSSMRSPMDARSSPIIGDMVPKKRGRKKKVRDEYE